MQDILQLYKVVAVAIVNDEFGEPIVEDGVVFDVQLNYKRIYFIDDIQFVVEVVPVMLVWSLLTSFMAGLAQIEIGKLSTFVCGTWVHNCNYANI